MQDVSAFNTAGVVNYTGGNFPEQLKSGRISADFFRLVGAPLLIGRAFTADEDRPQGPKVAVISRSLWETRFNADPTFHRNDTVDYNLILSGRIVALTESGEVELGPGDVLIQRGTAHTWSNRWSEPCVYASIMVSALPAGGAAPAAEAAS